jgi:hypothetical protein
MALRDYFRAEVDEHVVRGGCWFPGAPVTREERFAGLQPVEIGAFRGEGS